MNDKGFTGNARRMGMMIPLVLFVLVFVVCCGVLAGVFLRAADINARAGDCTAGVQLCRNTAELCRAGQAAGLSQCFYDAHYQPTAEGAASYRVTVNFRDEAAAAGILRSYTITAYGTGQEPLYSLEVTVYLPEEVAYEQ